MSDGRAQLERALFDELRVRLGTALAGFAGEAPAISGDPLPSLPAEAGLRWKQPLNPLPGAVWMAAAEASWKGLSAAALAAAGVTDSDDAERKSTYLEIVNQTVAGFAQALTKRMGQEVTPATGAEADQPPAPTRWADAHAHYDDSSFALVFGLEPDLLNALFEKEFEKESADEKPAKPAAPALEIAAPVAAAEISEPRTFDLLLDVEMPVSVSFGRAQVALKDVLKLTTGSIVELNRAIAEPVEVIVNNCVIARGEVVVVEGNFGVRIQEVISRQERLRTLQ